MTTLDPALVTPVGDERAAALRADAQARQDEMVALRRELHATPEVGLDLPHTQEIVLRELEGLPLEITTGTALTSVTAVLRGRAPLPEGARRPVVLLRGDMDGLPVTEQTGLEFASTNGNMHACGHDFHVAGLIGAARILAARADELPADVVFMFQPGEESWSGAKYMVEEGVLDAAGNRVDVAYSWHVFSSGFPRGKMFVRPGTMMASSDNLDVVVRGQGGHGSRPYQAKDPVMAVCAMILDLQLMIARRFDVLDPAVLSVGELQSGAARAVIPDTARFAATMRTFSTTAQRRLFDLIPPRLRALADAHEVEVDVTMERMYPPLTCTRENVDVALATIGALFGPERGVELADPITGSEDLAFVLREVPGAFVGVSAFHDGGDSAEGELETELAFNHNPHADFDESALAEGAALLAALAFSADFVPVR